MSFEKVLLSHKCSSKALVCKLQSAQGLNLNWVSGVHPLMNIQKKRNLFLKMMFFSRHDIFNLSPPVIVLLAVPMQCFFCGSFLLFHSTLSVPCSILVTWWERAWQPGSLVCYVFLCFAPIPYDVLRQVTGQVWYLIVWIPDLCLLPYCVAMSFITSW